MLDHYRILIIDDHPLFRDALRSAIDRDFPGSFSEDVRNLDEAIATLQREDAFDVALLDLSIPGVHGFDGLLRLRQLSPRLPILIVSSFEDNRIIHQALGLGAAGFVPKSVDRETLGQAIGSVLDGNGYLPEGYRLDEVGEFDDDQADLVERIASLTPQQLRVLQMLRAGLLNKQIAAELNVGATTVKAHVSEVLRKLQVYSRTQAVIEASKVDYSELLRQREI